MAGIATFLGGVVPDSAADETLAYQAGQVIGRRGMTLYHGGYNGLMECVAKGAAEQGSDIIAVTLKGKEEWGGFNPHVTRSLYLGDLGQRMNTLLSNADIVFAMAGGVGTLHEVTAAIWYAGNVRKMPVVLIGQRAERLLDFAHQDRWIYESPTRPIDFLSVARTGADLDAVFDRHRFQSGAAAVHVRPRIGRDMLDAALVSERYVRADGTVLDTHFDPFELCRNPKDIQAAANAIAQRADQGVDVVVGVALGGVSLATLVAQVMERPLALIRPEPKQYGVFAQVEGHCPPGARALLIDDVVRTGAHMQKAKAVLAGQGAQVVQAACLLRRGQGHVGLGFDLISLSQLPDEAATNAGELHSAKAPRSQVETG